MLPRSGGTTLPVRLREEIQEMLRRGGGELNALWLPPLLGIS
jgi:hypothetical protein